ncbi:hypothetical protein [Pseudomonas sp. TMW22089]|uniref:hypothetical protein n=1 Tax=Pseudomonas sp. TMW22089 TaxID=2506433 RepID=UPI001F0D389E|nr:hypothetical protein [Pseudomonas sp. TMW22089]
MHQLPERWQKNLVGAGLLSLLVFGCLSARHAWIIYKDIPRAPCYASVYFNNVEYSTGRWSGAGDITISPKEDAIYVYYKIKSPDDITYIYNRKFEVSTKKLDTSRFLFETTNVVTLNRPGFPRHSPGSLRNAFQTLPVTADC